LSDDFVADSSIAIAWVVREQSTKDSDLLLQRVDSNAQFYVPTLWMFEVANALLVLLRRKRIDSEHYDRARRDLIDLVPVVDDECSRFALDRTSELAKKYALSAYDATYLELSLRRGLPLASRDGALNKAAKAAGIKILFSLR
jgi:predicted nucleic acid-binding protein